MVNVTATEGSPPSVTVTACAYEHLPWRPLLNPIARPANLRALAEPSI
jgi:hypothetical protein